MGSDSESDTYHCVFVLTPRFNMMAANNLLEPLRVANYLSEETLYTHEFCSADGVSLTASNGMTQVCTSLPETLERNTTVFVIASWGGETYSNSKLLAWLRLQYRNGIQICGVEIGAYILAAAGLLEGRTATTHRAFLKGFQERYPGVDVTDCLFTDVKNVMTCAGATACLDLMLHFIQQSRGEVFASEVAEQIIHHPIRPGRTPQRATRGRGIDGVPQNVRAAVEIIEENIEEPWRVADISKAVGISQRQLERRFNAAFNCSVARFAQLMRLQHARVLLVTTDLGISEISTASGFNTQSHFNQAFKRCFGRKPSEYRTAWPEAEAEPKWPGTMAAFLETVTKGKAD